METNDSKRVDGDITGTEQRFPPMRGACVCATKATSGSDTCHACGGRVPQQRFEPSVERVDHDGPGWPDHTWTVSCPLCDWSVRGWTTSKYACDAWAGHFRDQHDSAARRHDHPDDDRQDDLPTRPVDWNRDVNTGTHDLRPMPDVTGWAPERAYIAGHIHGHEDGARAATERAIEYHQRMYDDADAWLKRNDETSGGTTDNFLVIVTRGTRLAHDNALDHYRSILEGELEANDGE